MTEKQQGAASNKLTAPYLLSGETGINIVLYIIVFQHCFVKCYALRLHCAYIAAFFLRFGTSFSSLFLQALARSIRRRSFSRTSLV